METLKRILLVQDDPKDTELILSALGEYNLANEIMVLRDGMEALDCLYRREAFALRPEGNPVVILLDLKMPRLDGVQVLRQLKADEPMRSIPVVILTSSRESRDLEECYRLGGQCLRRQTGSVHGIRGSHQGDRRVLGADQ